MNNQQAIQILIQAAEVAVTKGAFQLKDAGVISQAVEFLKNPPKPVQPPVVKDEQTALPIKKK